VIWDTPWGQLAQGAPDANIYAASEVFANPEACAKGYSNEIRDRFEGRVIG